MTKNQTKIDDRKPVQQLHDDKGEQRPFVSTPHTVPEGKGGHVSKVSTDEQSTHNPLVDDAIRPGAIQKLVVPRENIGAEIVESQELDLGNLGTMKIRKPERREWFVLKHDSELPTRLLIHKPKPESMDEEFFFVHSNLRPAIREELKDVRVFVYYGAKTKTHFLWIVKVTLDNSWYESLNPLLTLKSEFFEDNEIRVISDKPTSRYRVRFRPKTSNVTWPQKLTDQLLGEALGEDHFINDAEHPLYRDLIEGDEL